MKRNECYLDWLHEASQQKFPFDERQHTLTLKHPDSTFLLPRQLTVLDDCAELRRHLFWDRAVHVLLLALGSWRPDPCVTDSTNLEHIVGVMLRQPLLRKEISFVKGYLWMIMGCTV